jgi:hypothetical protein
METGTINPTEEQLRPTWELPLNTSDCGPTCRDRRSEHGGPTFQIGSRARTAERTGCPAVQRHSRPHECPGQCKPARASHDHVKTPIATRRPKNQTGGTGSFMSR